MWTPNTGTHGSIGHYQNKWEPGSESATQRHLESSKQNCRTTTIVAVCAARYTAIVLPRHFCLLAWSIDWILSPQTIPSAIAVMSRTQLPARFGNGHNTCVADVRRVSLPNSCCAQYRTQFCKSKNEFCLSNREFKHRRVWFTDVNRKALFRHCNQWSCVDVFDTEVTDVRRGCFPFVLFRGTIYDTDIVTSG